MVNEKTFCIGPWSEVRVNQDGSLLYCHAAAADGQSNVNALTIEQYLNGEHLGNVRKSLLAGETTSGCARCYLAEEQGFVSFRHRRNSQIAIFPKSDFAQSFNESNFTEYAKNNQPRFYHVSLGNLCNLGCVMCDARSSSFLAKDLKEAGLYAGPLSIDWSADVVVWQQFLDHVLKNKHIVCFHFMGGEPLYHKRFYEFIDFCIANNHTDFHFTFVTNGSIFKPALREKLQKFKGVQIELSIESVSTSNDYIRYPSDTAAIVANLKKFLSWRDDKLSVVVRTVPQFFSMIHYPELINFCVEHDVMVDSNVLGGMAFMLPKQLPAAVKLRIMAELKQIEAVIGPSESKINVRLDPLSSIRNNIHMCKTHLALNEEPALHDELRNYCEKLDRVRKINVRNFFPELADYFEKHGFADV